MSTPRDILALHHIIIVCAIPDFYTQAPGQRFAKKAASFHVHSYFGEEAL